jgi:hypothetical protein
MHDKYISAIEISKDSELIITGDKKGIIKIWQV